MKVGKLAIQKPTFKRLLLLFGTFLVIFLVYVGILLLQNLRELYAYHRLMNLPRHQVNLELIDSAFTHKPHLLNEKDKFGWTAIHWNSVWCRKNVVKVMLKHGVDVNKRTRRGLTPLHLSMRLSYGDRSREFINYLIDNGAGLNNQDKYGWTPLHEAIVEGNKLGVAALVLRGADVNTKNNKGDGSLHVAVLTASIDVIEILVNHDKLNINSKNNNGWTPLHVAAFTGRQDVAEILLENGAEINAKDNSNLTPLQTASINGKERMVQLLSSNGGL